MAVDLKEIYRLWGAGKFRDDHLGTLVLEIKRLEAENAELEMSLDDALRHPQCGCYD
jgi:hypothetical protein